MRFHLPVFAAIFADQLSMTYGRPPKADFRSEAFNSLITQFFYTGTAFCMKNFPLKSQSDKTIKKVKQAYV